ncbi:swr1 complex component [Clydaea vesicula]|uniref:Swr1 complex component n=1 Tax=Clydaea vesicula TaxID=447962 RepID=A0AAD5U044_9FUNG|nr:swr1 complex component [Clydaea vesicula]
MSSSVKRSKRKLISSDDENLEVRRINLSPLKIKRCNLELNSLEKNLDFDTFADEYCNEPSDDIYNKYNRRVMIRKMQFLFSLKPELELKGKVNYPPPKRNKKLAKYLDSFVFLEDDLEFSREQYEFYLNEQIEMINSIQQFEAEHGKIEAPMPTPIQYKSFHDPIPKVNFTDTLMNEMKYISKIMIDMRKHKVIICRKVAKSIQKYWESRDLVEGKSGKQEEKRIKKLAKDTANEVRKQWKLVEAIITSKKKMVADLEAQKAGKLHLFAIIEQSAQVLKDQQQDMLLNELEGSDEERSQENSNPDEEVSGSLLDDDELSEISSENSFSSEEHLGDDQGLEQLIGDMDFENSKYNANNLEMSDVVEDDRDQRLNDDLGEVNDQMDADAIVISTQELSSNIIDADNTAVTDYDVNEKTNTDADSILNIKEANDVKLDMHTPVTPIPPLLKHTLRSYQHTGLDWLVGLYNKGLNGILADEMGLGKTIQTISLLAYLAFYKGNWGPHLIVVPTSVILNWEYEFKKWCPAFKILTYFGNQKERKEKRLGWSKENSFHICITSYQLVLSDQNNFKRKFWQYLILDEAHNIKNFRSQRWQTLLTFNSVRRLLLTGTPLQNNLLELWSLLYFLMPRGSVSSSEIMPTGFASQKEFQEWFQNPVDKIIEKNSEHDKETKDTILKLHTVLRPFLLRRLKKDVEKEMPSKIEHVVSCRLSRRQKYLYDDFMSRAKTKEDLSSGNFMSILNCLMQLRKENIILLATFFFDKCLT